MDVYALGVLMWEMCNGQSAWRGMTQSEVSAFGGWVHLLLVEPAQAQEDQLLAVHMRVHAKALIADDCEHAEAAPDGTCLEWSACRGLSASA